MPNSFNPKGKISQILTYDWHDLYNCGWNANFLPTRLHFSNNLPGKRLIWKQRSLTVSVTNLKKGFFLCPKDCSKTNPVVAANDI